MLVASMSVIYPHTVFQQPANRLSVSGFCASIRIDEREHLFFPALLPATPEGVVAFRLTLLVRNKSENAMLIVGDHS